MKNTAIVLAAGRGKRMQSNTPKQYLEIAGKPVLYYTLRAFENSFIDSIVLVTAEDEMEYCKKEIVEKYGFTKVKEVIAGGKERYHSVMNGIFSAKPCDYIYIHDGARPFVTSDMLMRLSKTVEKEKACVAAMPVKDTIKIADENGYVADTPAREYIWTIQTPQVFSYELIKEAYNILKKEENTLKEKKIQITDDAMVVETFLGEKVKLVEGSYSNIKITTPEDMDIASELMKKHEFS